MWCLAAVLSLGVPSALAQSQLITVRSEGPVTIRADEVEYDDQGQIYTAKGQVEITRDDVRLIADSIRLDGPNLIAEAAGRVRLETPDQVITGTRMTVDLQDGTGKIYQGQIFVKSAHYYMRGEEIEKTGPETYRMLFGEYTTCDGSQPAWTIRGEEMEVTLEGQGTARHTSFRVRDVPILYTPYLVFPAKFKRQSGFLSPYLGQSQRDGFVASVPYYKTLGEDQDATLTLTYMTERGFDLGGEYRYHLAPGSKGMLMVDWLPHDDKAQELFEDGTNAEANNSRWWIRGKADQALFNDTMTLRADIDFVSDQDYLREFTFGYMGFASSNQRFIQWLGRDLEPEGSLTRQSKLNLLRTWSSSTFNASLIYNDDLVNGNDRTLQQLPTLSFDATRQPVGETGLYFQMNSSYNYYYRPEGSSGHISDISPSVSLPLNFNDYLEFEPSVTYSPRFYAVSLDDGEDPGDQETGMSNIWSTSLVAQTYLYRVFDFSTPGDPFKIKHAMRPRITYDYRPDSDENDIASLARRSFGQTNQLSWGIDNAFTYKIMGKDDQTGAIRPIYREFLRFNLSQVFDIDEFRQDKAEGTGDNRPWGNFAARVEFDPNRYLYAESDISWNPYNNRFETINAQLKASDTRGDAIDLDYRYNHGGVNQLTARLSVAITKEVSAHYIWRTDLKEERDFENTFEMRYSDQCWGLRLFYTDNIRERAFYLAFSIGDFGEIFGWGQNQ